MMKSIENFTYVTSAVITPLFLVAGTFFPIDRLPEWAQVLANLNPLYHCVQLVRDAVFGLVLGRPRAPRASSSPSALVMWRLAIIRMERG